MQDKQRGNHPGKFIVIEGGDGAGKTTQMGILEEMMGDSLVLTREPGGTEYAEQIRELMLTHPLAKNADGKTLFMLMWASRAEHMNRKVAPALRDGKTVISDRFDSSSFAYNIYGQEDFGLEEYFWQTRTAILGQYVPDLYIYLEVDEETARQRKSQVGDPNHFDARPLEFRTRVNDGYKKFLKKVPHVIIDATQDIPSVQKDILQAIENVQVV